MAGELDKKPSRNLSDIQSKAVADEARENLQLAWQSDRDNRQEAMRDLRFLANDQWPDAVKRQRQAEHRPMLTINVLPQFLRQVTNDIRQADLSIKVSPVDNKSDPKLAKVYNGLLKQIQYKSSAKAIYASAAEHQCGCGIGWFEVVTDYADEDSFDQEVLIKRIPYPLSVYDDPNAVEPDRSDSMHRNITYMLSKEAFERKYPDKRSDSVDRPSDGSEWLSWGDTDKIRLSNYWRKTPYEKTLALLPDGAVIDITELDRSLLPMLQIVRTRKHRCHKVEMYVVSGHEVLEGPYEWAGKHLPQVPVIGSEIPLEHGCYRYGVIRMARDPAQLYNYAQSAIAEYIGMAPKAPYKATADQIGPYKEQWDSANVSNRPYLLYKRDAPNDAGPTREHPPELPVALIKQAETAAEDQKRTTGLYDASLGKGTSAQSGVSIARQQLEGDTANYHYADNFQRSLEYAGRVIIDLIPKIYDNERTIRILGDDETEEFVEINKVLYEMGDQKIMVNDLSQASFDVRVTIGPSQSTKRIEQSQFMSEFIKLLDPPQRAATADLLAASQDWEGAEEIAKRLKNMVPPALLVDPEDPNAPPPPDPMDDPMVQLDMAEKEGKARKLEAEADRAEIENAMLVGQAEAGYHPTQQPPAPPAPPKQPKGPR